MCVDHEAFVGLFGDGGADVLLGPPVTLLTFPDGPVRIWAPLPRELDL